MFTKSMTARLRRRALVLGVIPRRACPLTRSDRERSRRLSLVFSACSSRASSPAKMKTSTQLKRCSAAHQLRNRHQRVKDATRSRSGANHTAAGHGTAAADQQAVSSLQDPNNSSARREGSRAVPHLFANLLIGSAVGRSIAAADVQARSCSPASALGVVRASKSRTTPSAAGGGAGAHYMEARASYCSELIFSTADRRDPPRKRSAKKFSTTPTRRRPCRLFRADARLLRLLNVTAQNIKEPALYSVVSGFSRPVPCVPGVH